VLLEQVLVSPAWAAVAICVEVGSGPLAGVVAMAAEAATRNCPSTQDAGSCRGMATHTARLFCLGISGRLVQTRHSKRDSDMVKAVLAAVASESKELYSLRLSQVH